MHFKTIKRDEILPMIDQAKNKKEQKKILCQLLECDTGELDALIKELKAEKAEKAAQYELCEEASGEALKADDEALIKKVARDDELAAISAYANELQETLRLKDEEIEGLKRMREAEHKAFERRETELAKEIEQILRDAELAKDLRRDVEGSLMKSQHRNLIISELLSKSLEFITLINGVMSDLLKA